jgi:hypothetical protein
MLFDIPFITDWKKLENIGKDYLILTLPVKMKAGLIMITKLVRKYLYKTKVYSAKQSPDGRKTPGQLNQSIKMEQSQFNVETKKKD